MSTQAGKATSRLPAENPSPRTRIHWLMGAKGNEASMTALLMLPALLFLAICFLVPLTELLVLSFGDKSGTFASYGEILSDDVVRVVFANTIKLAAVVTLISVTLAYPAAYLLTTLKGLALSIALYCVLVPFWVSVLVRTFSWMMLLERNGPINNFLRFAGLIDKPLPLLFNDFSVYVGMIHILLPYAILPIYSAMLKVDHRLILASNGLGASAAQTFWKIYVPLTSGGIIAGALFVFLMSLGFYITPALLGGFHSLTVSLLVDNFVNERLVWPLAAATAVLLLIVILIILTVTSRFVALGQVMASR